MWWPVIALSDKNFGALWSFSQKCSWLNFMFLSSVTYHFSGTYCEKKWRVELVILHTSDSLTKKKFSLKGSSAFFKEVVNFCLDKLTRKLSTWDKVMYDNLGSNQWKKGETRYRTASLTFGSTKHLDTIRNILNTDRRKFKKKNKTCNI